MEAAQKDPVMDPLLAAEPKSPNPPDPRSTNHLNTLNEDHQISGEKAPGSLTGQLDSVHPLLDGHSNPPSEEPEADGIAQHSAETDPQPPESNVPLGRYSSRRRPHRNSTRENHLKIARANISFSRLKPVLKPLACLLGGCALAIGHHIFNSWADGKSIDSGTRIPQVWVLRIGTGFAFAFKAILAASLSFVICQLLWFSARRKYLTVQDIDTLYLVERRDIISTVLSNAVMNGPLLVGATLLSFMLPIAAVFTPASLGVKAITYGEEAPCVIAAGNFHQVDDNGVPLFYQANICTPIGDLTATVSRMSEITFSSGSPMPLPEFCGNNCTYKVIVDSMSFKCDVNQPLPPGQMGTFQPGNQPLGPVTLSFWNATATGDQIEPTLPIYVGWATGSWRGGWDTSLGTAGGAYCVPVHAQYEFSVQTINGAQYVTYNVTTFGQLEPVVPPPNAQYPDGSCRIGNIPGADLQTAAIALAARRLLLGSLAVTSSVVDTEWTHNSTVRLASFLNVTTPRGLPDELYIWKDVVKGIEDTAANVTATLLNLDAGRQNSTCSYGHSTVVYDYNPTNLLVPYGVAIFIVAVSLMFGVFVFLRFNPDDLTTSFADTIGITRNSEMEIFARKHDGQDELEPSLHSVKFRLGELPGGYMGYGTKQDF
ncbi:hypothetical protein FRC04_004533 [Tulasnella sp. 424]|nr:hypothetical protein FRC04_004533 [Tulasnella sp. 424]KAG8976603.1 hypothetical protein FRC05_003442 [Tulasnella sp. 425]